MGNIRKNVADNAKIEALTTIVETLGTELQQTKAMVQAMQDCADQGKIYVKTTNTCAGQDVEVISVSAHLPTYESRTSISADCPTGTRIISCNAKVNTGWNIPVHFINGNSCELVGRHPHVTSPENNNFMLIAQCVNSN